MISIYTPTLENLCFPDVFRGFRKKTSGMKWFNTHREISCLYSVHLRIQWDSAWIQENKDQNRHLLKAEKTLIIQKIEEMLNIF